MSAHPTFDVESFKLQAAHAAAESVRAELARARETATEAETTAARIDSFGVVTAKCTAAKGVVDTVTAIATADTTVKAIALLGVAQQTTCP